METSNKMEIDEDCEGCGNFFKNLEKGMNNEIIIFKNIISTFYVAKISKLENELMKKIEEIREMNARIDEKDDIIKKFNDTKGTREDTHDTEPRVSKHVSPDFIFRNESLTTIGAGITSTRVSKHVSPEKAEDDDLNLSDLSE